MPGTTNAGVAGTWTGVAKQQQCTGSPASFCDLVFKLAAFKLVLEDVSGQLRGTLTAGAYVLTVTGSVDSNGALSLSGDGQTYPLLDINVAQWQTRVSGQSMTGAFTLNTRSITQSSAAVITLESVFKAGSVEASRPIPPELRFALVVKGGTASRYAPGVSPGVTQYNGCQRIQNAAPVRARLTYIITPIGVDGRDYAVQQMVFQGPSLDVSAATELSGCAGGGALDFDYRRPIASSYRLRVEYAYDDGVTGAAEGIAPVTIGYDAVGN